MIKLYYNLSKPVRAFHRTLPISTTHIYLYFKVSLHVSRGSMNSQNACVSRRCFYKEMIKSCRHNFLKRLKKVFCLFNRKHFPEKLRLHSFQSNLPLWNRNCQFVFLSSADCLLSSHCRVHFGLNCSLLRCQSVKCLKQLRSVRVFFYFESRLFDHGFESFEKRYKK